MFSNKVLIGIGGLIFFTVATGFIMLGLQQRQAIRPDAQQIDTQFSCPIGGVPADPTGKCPSGFVPVPVLPTGGGQQSIGTGSVDGGAFGGNDIGPTSSIQVTPTPQILGFCCVPVGLPSPTLPIDEPTPTLVIPTLPVDQPTPTIPTGTIPTPTSCPGGGEQLSVTTLDGCSATERCDFSVVSDGGTGIAARSLWSDGTFNFGAQGQAFGSGDNVSTQRFDEQIFTYPSPGTYDVSLTCGDSLKICTKQVTITDGGPGVCTSPTPTVPTPSTGLPTLTPTPPACTVPFPKLRFRCPEGCSQL